MKKRYDPKTIEIKWQKEWKEKGIYHTPQRSSQKKYYCLVMFPYPSGDLHIGHWYNFGPADVHARYMRMKGRNVLFPLGFDAFGLPAENAAMKRSNLHPSDWTQNNIKTMTVQLEHMGAMYDWDRVVDTSNPSYYKWTQWMFIQLYKKGLAYKTMAPANWCPQCQTVLANEQAENGVCWRCGSEVTRKDINQWFFKITAYAEELLDGLHELDWPEKTKLMQKNWIGKSVGARINFTWKQEILPVFTTRPDTIFGVTFMAIAPEHPLVPSMTTKDQKKVVEEYVQVSRKETETERLSTDREKTGVFTGSYAKNPINGKEIPIYVADYVLQSYGYGVVMGVPAHDQRDYDFAKKYDLPIVEVVSGGDSKKEAWEGEGKLVNSGEFTGFTSVDGRKKIIAFIEKKKIGNAEINYRIRDWLVSRQRYWGAPIPMIHCKTCGWVPVPESDLPVLLPRISDFQPTGTEKGPLVKSKEFVETSCPTCGGKAERETDTMDTFVDSSWYFLRYPNSNLSEAAFDEKEMKYWLPVDMYVGGAEHTVLHLLYSRFFTKALRDMGYLSFDEPFRALRHQGIILGPDRQKMSKSRGNVINPDELVENFGTDTVRTYLCFMSQYDQGGPWDPQGISGSYRFLGRVYMYFENRKYSSGLEEKDVERLLHKTIKKVGDDMASFKFNTAVASLMEFLNLIVKRNITKETARTYFLLLAPFAPHLAEELWKNAGGQFSVHTKMWPEYDEKKLQEGEKELVIQVNGKLRDTLQVKVGLTKEQAQKIASLSERVKAHIQGKKIRKVIYIPDTLINLVTED